MDFDLIYKQYFKEFIGEQIRHSFYAELDSPCCLQEDWHRMVQWTWRLHSHF